MSESSARGTAARVLLSAALLTGLNVAAGRLLARHCFDDVEAAVNHRLQANRTPAKDAVAVAASWSTDVPRAIASTAGLVGALRWRTGSPRFAAAAGLATMIASTTHVASSLIVRRPRPAISRLGTRQVTSSYPSGHVGAITAQCLTLGLLSQRLPPGARRAATAACVTYPIVVGWSRLYSGQHFVSDVLAGYANGVVSGLVAWRALTLLPVHGADGVRGGVGSDGQRVDTDHR